MRGHRNGHNSSADETLAMLALAEASAPLNDVSATNGGPIGPAAAVAWASAAFTPKTTGKLLIMATITGNDATVSEVVASELRKNTTAATGANFAALGGSSVGPAGMQTDAGLQGDFGNSIQWVDTVPVGTAVTYAICAAATHNLTIPTGGASITIVEL